MRGDIEAGEGGGGGKNRKGEERMWIETRTCRVIGYIEIVDATCYLDWWWQDVKAH